MARITDWIFGTSAAPNTGDQVPAFVALGSNGLPIAGGGASNANPGADYAKDTKQDAGNAALGTTADAAYSGTGSSSIVAALKGVYARLAGTLTATLAAGSAVIGAVTQSGSWNITNVTGTVSLPTGAATSAAQTTGNTSAATTATAAGAPADATWTGTGSGSIISVIKAVWSAVRGRHLYVAESSFALAASGQLSGGNYVANPPSPSPYRRLLATAYSNVAGTTYIIDMNDGLGHFAQIQSAVLAAGVVTSIDIPLPLMSADTRFRIYLVNGATPATLAFTSIGLTV